jgi:hypothetical protein
MATCGRLSAGACVCEWKIWTRETQLTRQTDPHILSPAHHDNNTHAREGMWRLDVGRQCVYHARNRHPTLKDACMSACMHDASPVPRQETRNPSSCTRCSARHNEPPGTHSNTMCHPLHFPSQEHCMWCARGCDTIMQRRDDLVSTLGENMTQCVCTCNHVTCAT